MHVPSPSYSPIYLSNEVKVRFLHVSLSSVARSKDNLERQCTLETLDLPPEQR